MLDSMVAIEGGKKSPVGALYNEVLDSVADSLIYHLALAFLQVELIPVYLDTLHRSFSKGTYLPVPLICTAHFGELITLLENEPKKDFLVRAMHALLTLIFGGKCIMTIAQMLVVADTQKIANV